MALRSAEFQHFTTLLSIDTFPVTRILVCHYHKILRKDCRHQDWQSYVGTDHRSMWESQFNDQSLLRVLPGRKHFDCWRLSQMQMGESQFTDLPCDVISKIISLLPLTDRARLEAVCKTFCRLSLVQVTTVDFSMRTKRDSVGLSQWLQKLSMQPAQSLQKLKIYNHNHEERRSPLSPQGENLLYTDAWSD